MKQPAARRKPRATPTANPHLGLAYSGWDAGYALPVKNLVGLSIACAAIGFVIFVGVGITEINYVAGHPNAYGPAKVIAWGAGAGALLSAAIASLGAAVMRRTD